RPAVRSHTVALPSASPPTPTVPVPLAANEVTNVVWEHGRSMIGAPLSASQTWVRPSVVDATTCVCPGSAYMLETSAEVGTVYARRPEASRHTRVAWSFEVVIARVPSPVTTALVTGPAWPCVASRRNLVRWSAVAHRVSTPASG